MNQKRSLLKHLFAISAFILPLNLMAQEDVGGFFKATPADASKLVNAYMHPIVKGFGVALNSSWNTTAKAKNFLTFDIRGGASLAFVPTADRTYNANNLGLTNIRPAAGQNGIGQTASGESIEGSTMEFHNNGTTIPGQTFKLPEGTGFHGVPAPQLQLTVGLPKNIDITLRYMPEIKISDDLGKIGVFGVGAKVEVFPLIMGKKDKLIPFDLAVAFGITRLNYNLPLNINNQSNSDQELDIKINGFNAEAIVSKKILFFTPFASVAYNSSTSDLRALGTYQFQTALGPRTYTDPVKIKNNDINGIKATLGFQLNMAFIRFYASYTQAEYNYASAGIGFGIGK